MAELGDESSVACWRRSPPHETTWPGRLWGRGGALERIEVIAYAHAPDRSLYERERGRGDGR